MTILSVDDSTTIRRIVKRSCEELGHTVLEAADGKSALAILADKSIEVSLIVLDWHMPGLTGADVLKAIKSDPLRSATTVLVLTSESDMHVANEALVAGAQNCLNKPFAQESLTLKIQECLQVSVG